MQLLSRSGPYEGVDPAIAFPLEIHHALRGRFINNIGFISGFKDLAKDLVQ